MPVLASQMIKLSLIDGERAENVLLEPFVKAFYLDET